MQPGKHSDTDTRISQLMREIAQLRASIKHTSEYIATNRHDRESVRDADEDLAHYESQLAAALEEHARLVATVMPQQVVPAPSVSDDTKPAAAPADAPQSDIKRKKLIPGYRGRFAKGFSIRRNRPAPAQDETAQKIRSLTESYRILDDRLTVLDDNIFSCTLNMDISQRGADVATQAMDDLARYQTEYESVSDQMNQVAAQIQLLRGTQTR